MNNRAFRVLEYQKIKEKLASRATSSLGKDKVHELIPSTDIEFVKKTMEETAEAVNLLLKFGEFPSGPIYDVTDWVKRAKVGGALSAQSLLYISDTLRTARRIKSFISTNHSEENPVDILFSYSQAITSLKMIEDSIGNAINSDGTIADNASGNLRRIRREKDNKKLAIRKKLDAIIRSDSQQKYIQDALITMRQDRFVIPVKTEHKNRIKGLVHDQSSSGSTSYVEPMVVVEMNNELRQLDAEEQAEIEKILLEISLMVSEYIDELVVNQQMLTQIDFVAAKGRLALDMKAVEPKFNERGYVNIRNGRHPLLDSDNVVPLNIYLGDKFTTLLITGPNTGGKTVSLKTLGLFALMAQSGLFLPADSQTVMPIFDGVYADIGDEQSIEQSLSTFSAHMKNIVEILDSVSDNSLVLFDELGAGTDPEEGAALAMSILSILKYRSIRTVATTHYSELKQFALVSDGMENASVEFDIQTLSPTYKLLIGVPGKSNAFEISKRLGLSDEVISSAQNFLDKSDIELENVLTTLEKNRKDLENQKDEAIRLRLEVELLKKEYTEKKTRLDEQRDKIINSAKAEARNLLKRTKEDSESIIKELRNMKHKNAQDNKSIESMRNKIRKDLKSVQNTNTPKPDMRGDVLKEVRLGQSVHIRGVSQIGSILSLPDDNGELTVQVGIIKMKTHIKELRLAKDDTISDWEKASKKRNRHQNAKVPDVSIEKDVRGMTTDEASYMLDKYIDEACLAGLEKVRIIHGKGTGALRKGLMEFFRHHHQVKKIEQAPLNEGGAGVSVLTLK